MTRVERERHHALAAAVDRDIAGFSGDVGFFATNLVTGETLGRREDAVMPTASTIKVCVLCELHRQAAAVVVRLHDRVEMTETDLCGAQPLRVMNKTGFSTGVRVDAAILRLSEAAAVVATMTEGSADPSFSPEHEGLVVNGRIGKAVYDAWLAGA